MNKETSYETRYLIDTDVIYFPFLIALLIFFSGFTLAQSGERIESNASCRLPDLGGYVEISNSNIKWERPKGGVGPRWGKGRISDDEWWTPKGVDLVDPVYNLYLFAVRPDGMPEGKCATVVAIEGQLITPSGKVFRFEQATFDREILLLKFTTIRRDQLRYQGEFQFFSKPFLLATNGFQAGNVTLMAEAPDMGVVTLTFPAKSSRYE